MSKNDIKIVSGGGEVVSMLVDDRTTSSDIQIQPGEPVCKSNTNFVIHAADGTPTNASGETLWGIAKTFSTETTSAEGSVDVQLVVPGVTVLRIKATTPANLAQSIIQNAVTLDRTGTTEFAYTIDENEGDDPNVHGLIILSYDSEKGTVDCLVKGYANEPTSSY
jgi:hypothetical protein